MTFHALPRTPDGRIQLPGRLQTFDCDFSQVTALPTWLTAVVGTGGAIGIIGGELEIQGSTAKASPSYVSGPQKTLSDLQSIALTVYDMWLPTGISSGNIFQGITTPAAIAGNTGLGAMLHVPSGSRFTHLRGTTNDGTLIEVPPSPTAVDNNLNKQTARSTRTLIILPRTGMVYAVEDLTEVMHARDLSATMTLGAVTPLIQSNTNSASGGAIRTVRCSRIKIEIGY